MKSEVWGKGKDVKSVERARAEHELQKWRVRKPEIHGEHTIPGYSSAYSLALGTKLSLKGAVLKRLLHIRQNNDLLPTRDMCSTVFLDELKPIWFRARIPIKSLFN